MKGYGILEVRFFGIDISWFKSEGLQFIEFQIYFKVYVCLKGIWVVGVCFLLCKRRLVFLLQANLDFNMMSFNCVYWIFIYKEF